MIDKTAKIPILILVFIHLFNPFAVLAAESSHMPVISIIIDDIGYRSIDDRNALALPGLITFAVMPHAPNVASFTRLAATSGKDIILHLPMEAVEQNKNRFLGPGRLTRSMNEVQFIATLIYDLRSVPNIIGVNNHMGSLLSTDKEKMGWLMDYLHSKKVFYIDSVTTGHSVAAYAAINSDVPYLRRDVFLDNSTDPVAINAQFDELIRMARQNGSAIAIGHPHPETIEVLAKKLGNLAEYGVRLVSVKSLISEQGNTMLVKNVSLN